MTTTSEPQVHLPLEAPNLPELRTSGEAFARYVGVDTTWLRFLEETRPGVDLALPGHRALMLRWLNSWGCRIRYPRSGEPDPFDAGVAAWWLDWSTTLPASSLLNLSDAETVVVGEACAALAATPVSGGPRSRTLGPTAAAKALYAARPAGIMPWDAAIATRLYGRRDAEAFCRHQRLGRAWARRLVAGSGADELTLPGLVGRPNVSLAKVLDEHLYVTITATA